MSELALHVEPIRDWGACRFASPLLIRREADPTVIRQFVDLVPGRRPESERFFEEAGPRRQLFFDPATVRAAVVTCGGLCPGLNNVIRSVFLELHYRYRVREVLGIRDGFRGLNPHEGRPPLVLSREFVSGIHQEGGTLLGSSRGPQEARQMVDFLLERDVQMLFCVGGDGTQRGAHAIACEALSRGTPLAVVGIPKTIDNDLAFCDRTFGFVTAVEKAREVIHLAHTEAKAAPRGIGLVKLMGRDAGFIACGATVVSQEVNFTLVPEDPFRLEGPGSFLAALARRMDDRGHAVIVVAEGAGQHLFPQGELETDRSGNRKYHDIGVHLRDTIRAHFTALGKPVELKYIDPSYIIRSVPANTDDSWLCDQLSRHAVHAAMAGKTDLMIGALHNEFIHLPIELAVSRKRHVDLTGPLWASVVAMTGQPERFSDT